MSSVPTDLVEAKAWVRTLPPELTGQLTFHLPLELQALELAGARDDVVRDRILRRTQAAFAIGLVDPPLYRWAERAYAETAAGLLDAKPETRLLAFARVAPLGAGLAGAAFHGLIRLGFGALRRDPREVARGLAYLRTRPQVLFMPSAGDSDALPLLPGAVDLSGATIFEALALVAGSPGVLGPAQVAGPVAPPAELCAAAIGLLLRNPSSFLAVHTVTGLHALAEVEALVVGRPPCAESPRGPLAGWWRAYAWALQACATLVEAMPPQTGGRAPESFPDVTAMTRAAIDSCEAHDVKVAVALSRLASMGVVHPTRALEAGARKLAATECSP